MKNKWPMGTYLPDSIGYNASRWCLNNNIYIYPVIESQGRWLIEINIAWNKNKSPDSYGKNEIWRKINEYYKYYYEKHSKK
jgi:hypothetical protein